MRRKGQQMGRALTKPGQRCAVGKKVMKKEEKRKGQSCVSLVYLILSTTSIKTFTLTHVGGKPLIFLLIIPFYITLFFKQELDSMRGKRKMNEFCF